MSYDTITAYVKKHTTGFAGHGVDHAIAVYKTAIVIIKSLLDEFDHVVILLASLLHDVVDHKNPNSPTMEQLEEFILTQTDSERAKIVIDLINNISYTKEVNGESKQFEYPYNVYRDAISDADKLEGLMIDRCIEYTNMKKGKVPEDVVQHCHDKLLKLLPHFIRTEKGKQLAKPLHAEIEKYVANNS